MLHIIWSIIIGFIVGLIARAVMPGVQHLGFIATALWAVGPLLTIRLSTDRPQGDGYRVATALAKEPSSFTIRASFMVEKAETMDLKEFQLHEKDTGSADVQVALLTRRIEHLTEHLKTNRKDHSSRRGLLKMVAHRRSLLDYLSKTKSDRYKNLIDKLNLRK